MKKEILLQYPLILASASPRRKELLEELGFVFRVAAVFCEELTDSSGLPGSVLAEKNACIKAHSAAEKYPDHLVIGADTVVVCSERIFGKPSSEEEAFAMLQALSGREHQVITGVAFYCLEHKIRESFYVETKVRFKPLSDPEIRTYMDLVPVMDKAGAYAIQDHGEILLEKMEGSLSNVIGLPCERVKDFLERFARKESM